LDFASFGLDLAWVNLAARPNPASPRGICSLAAGMTGAGAELRLSYDFSRGEGEKEPLGEGGCPLVSGEGRIGNTLTV
jgi:hypothetical protein